MRTHDWTGIHFGPALTLVSGKFLNGAPVLAVEVRSEEDYGPAAEGKMARKRADYFAAGTRVVWDVDVLREELVRVHVAEDPDQPRIYRRGDILEAEPRATSTKARSWAA